MNDYKKISSMEEIDQIEANKRASQLRHEIEQEAKSDRCLLCGKRVTSFANSHSIPRMILENISIDGKLYWMNSFIRYDEFDLDLGINKAGTFKCICRDCDSKYFQDYEDEDKLNVYPSTKVLAEISVKDYCQMIVKRRIEIALNNKTANMPNGHVL